MNEASLVVLTASDVERELEGRGREVVRAVADAYLAHRAGRTSLPHSVFLRFGDDRPDRIIALPAYLADDSPIAGIKWIASFPGNVGAGRDRASAVLIANCTKTGRPRAVLESSFISSHRTAASAALAAQTLHARAPSAVGLVGCGPINHQIARYLRIVMPSIREFFLCDLVPERADRLAEHLMREHGVASRRMPDAPSVLQAAEIVSFATTASSPHVGSLAGAPPGSTVLHVSLRDLSTAAIVAADNVVDDVDHVLRARTSLDLAQQEHNHHNFIRCTLADVLAGAAPPRAGDAPVVFSPFGLGILDLAVARLVLESASAARRGTWIDHFLPDSWAHT
jgi:ornithine cyclodeaminase